jgi:hypothetical protein
MTIIQKGEPMSDLISRHAAIEALKEAFNPSITNFVKAKLAIENLPSAQPTLYGYNIEHLALIATVLKKEDLPPERVVEAVTDIGRIVSIVRADCEEGFRKAVERCMI